MATVDTICPCLTSDNTQCSVKTDTQKAGNHPSFTVNLRMCHHHVKMDKSKIKFAKCSAATTSGEKCSKSCSGEKSVDLLLNGVTYGLCGSHVKQTDVHVSMRAHADRPEKDLKEIKKLTTTTTTSAIANKTVEKMSKQDRQLILIEIMKLAGKLQNPEFMDAIILAFENSGL